MNSLLSAIGRCSRLAQHGLRGELGTFGIGLGEFRVVGLLLDEPAGLSQAELCDRLGVTAPTLSVAVRALEQRGVVHRRTDGDDRRVKRVALRADAKLAKVQRMLERFETGMTVGISKKDLATTRKVLLRMSAELEKRAAQ